MANKLYLVKNQTVINAGLKTAQDNSKVIPFDNIQLGGDITDPKNVVVPTTSEVLAMVSAAANTVFPTAYVFRYKPSQFGFSSAIPTVGELEALYNGAGLLVQDMNGNDITLFSNAQPGDAQYKLWNDGEGVFVVNDSTGTYEQAGMTGTTIVIDQTKNNLPGTIAAMDAKIQNNATDIAQTKNQLSTLSTNQGTFLRAINDKDITAHGALTNTVNIAQPGRIPTRAEVNDVYKTLYNQLSGTVTNANSALTKANANAGDITILQGRTNTMNGLVQQAGRDITALETLTTQKDNSQDQRLAALEQGASGGVSQLLSAYTTYASDQGTPNTAGVFDLANLQNPNTGSATSADFDFNDEHIFDVKVRFDSTNNIIFQINVGDTEPTVIFASNNGEITAQLDNTGKLTLAQKGFTSKFDISTAVLTELREAVTLPASLVPTQQNVNDVKTVSDANAAAITTLQANSVTKTELTQEIAAIPPTDLSAYNTATEVDGKITTAINALPVVDLAPITEKTDHITIEANALTLGDEIKFDAPILVNDKPVALADEAILNTTEARIISSSGTVTANEFNKFGGDYRLVLLTDAQMAKLAALLQVDLQDIEYTMDDASQRVIKGLE